MSNVAVVEFVFVLIVHASLIATDSVILSVLISEVLETMCSSDDGKSDILGINIGDWIYLILRQGS
ncbi:hypothetical protein EI94DRAFT_1805171 [Lactarius quietus]|nr:hypothetical protein EI94DRAFT_1805171 [Lactarius quietus]